MTVGNHNNSSHQGYHQRLFTVPSSCTKYIHPQTRSDLKIPNLWTVLFVRRPKTSARRRWVSSTPQNALPLDSKLVHLFNDKILDRLCVIGLYFLVRASEDPYWISRLIFIRKSCVLLHTQKSKSLTVSVGISKCPNTSYFTLFQYL